jgi:hypothetical protein
MEDCHGCIELSSTVRELPLTYTILYSFTILTLLSMVVPVVTVTIMVTVI